MSQMGRELGCESQTLSHREAHLTKLLSSSFLTYFPNSCCDSCVADKRARRGRWSHCAFSCLQGWGPRIHSHFCFPNVFFPWPYPSLTLGFPSELWSLFCSCYCFEHGASVVLYLEAPLLMSARNRPVELPTPHKVLVTQLVWLWPNLVGVQPFPFSLWPQTEVSSLLCGAQFDVLGPSPSLPLARFLYPLLTSLLRSQVGVSLRCCAWFLLLICSKLT